MRSAVVVFPGSNCDADLVKAINCISPNKAKLVWHRDNVLPRNLDVIFIPGGFSYGDYLRCGSIAAQSPIMKSIIAFANSGGYVVGICNGFQILTEAKLLPGLLIRNVSLRFICCNQELRVNTIDSAFTNCFTNNMKIKLPVAHHDGNYLCSDEILHSLESNDRVAFSYIENKNGSRRKIAGILSQNRRVLGMMPHPERAMSAIVDNTTGATFFKSILSNFIS